MKRRIIKYLKSNSCPYFLFDLYFNRLNRARKIWLNELFENSDDLLANNNAEVRAHWEGRIELVKKSEDNNKIEKVNEAGKIIDGNLIMHNGIKIDPLSYYQLPVLKMLMENDAVHEPQEELVFQEVLKSLKLTTKSPIMLELGSYWSFYSMWLKAVIPESKCIMVEPERLNLNYGKLNFRLNDFKGQFIHSLIGSSVDRKRNITTVDEIVMQNNIDFIDILHSDIQGFEIEMLEGARQTLLNDKVGYLFISTHSEDLHSECLRVMLEEYNFDLIADANLAESYSWDGIIVLKSSTYPGLGKLNISKRNNMMRDAG